MKTKIEEVKSNQEKYLTMKNLFDDYDKAYKNKFYYQCLLLLYSIIEDRTESFFYHIGFTNSNRDKVHSNKLIKNSLIELFKLDIKNPKYYSKNLDNKLSMMIYLVDWAKSNEETSNEYLKELKIVLGKYITSDEYYNSLVYLHDEWRSMRNEITHALCKKNISDVNEKIMKYLDNGMKSIKIINSGISGIKRNHMRKKFKLQ